MQPLQHPKIPLVALLVLFLLALSVRLVYLYQTTSGPLFQAPQVDARWHAEWAERIAAGVWSDGRPFFRAPLYPFFLAAAYRFSGHSWVGAVIAQHLLGAASCVLLVLLSAKLYSAKTALLAGGISAVYGPLIYYENERLMPALAIFFFLLALLLLLRAAERPSPRRWLLGGLLLGCCAITRPNFLAVVPVVVVWWIGQQRRQRGAAALSRDLACLALGVAVPILPVTLHNLLLGKDWVLISAQGGVNFYIGNNPDSDGKTAVAYGPIAPLPSERYVDNVWSNSKLVAESAVGRPLAESEISRYWYRQGRLFWRQTPLQALTLLLRKTYYFFNGFEIESNRSIYLDALWSPLAGLVTWQYGVCFPLGVVLPLALVGMWLPSPRPAAARLLMWIALIYAITVISFFVTGRFRMPVVPLLILFAAHALSHLVLLIRQRRLDRLKSLLPAVLVLGLLCNSPWWSVREVQVGRQAALLGQAYLQLDQPAVAEAYFRKAIEYLPDYFAAHLNRGRALLWLGQHEEAARALQHALRLAPGSAVVHTEMGLALLGQGRRPDAAAMFQRALSLDPNDAEAHYQLAVILLGEERFAQAHAHFQRAAALGLEIPAEQLEVLREQIPQRAGD